MGRTHTVTITHSLTQSQLHQTDAESDSESVLTVTAVR